MARRKSLSRRTRFEVFKRDAFSCQYCGSHPPEVVLHIDHVVPVVEGGSNNIDNLITACQPCNSGKGAVSLKIIPQSLAERKADIEEREAQIVGYLAAVRKRGERVRDEIEQVANVYKRSFPGWKLTESAERSVGRFLEKLPVDEVLDAMWLAAERTTSDRAFKYFCGICWRRIRGEDGA